MNAEIEKRIAEFRQECIWKETNPELTFVLLKDLLIQLRWLRENPPSMWSVSGWRDAFNVMIRMLEGK